MLGQHRRAAPPLQVREVVSLPQAGQTRARRDTLMRHARRKGGRCPIGKVSGLPPLVWGRVLGRARWPRARGCPQPLWEAWKVGFLPGSSRATQAARDWVRGRGPGLRAEGKDLTHSLSSHSGSCVERGQSGWEAESGWTLELKGTGLGEGLDGRRKGGATTSCGLGPGGQGSTTRCDGRGRS